MLEKIKEIKSTFNDEEMLQYLSRKIGKKVKVTSEKVMEVLSLEDDLPKDVMKPHPIVHNDWDEDYEDLVCPQCGYSGQLTYNECPQCGTSLY